jgi:hypothetical protein
MGSHIENAVQTRDIAMWYSIRKSAEELGKFIPKVLLWRPVLAMDINIMKRKVLITQGSDLQF